MTEDDSAFLDDGSDAAEAMRIYSDFVEDGWVPKMETVVVQGRGFTLSIKWDKSLPAQPISAYRTEQAARADLRIKRSKPAISPFVHPLYGGGLHENYSIINHRGRWVILAYPMMTGHAHENLVHRIRLTMYVLADASLPSTRAALRRRLGAEIARSLPG